VQGRAPSTQETWDAFFSDFYLRAYATRGRDAEALAEAQALAAAGLAGCPEGGDVLDVPCGFGRHSVPLARAGYRVTGVDRSQTLVDEARRRSGEAEPRFVVADYRELPLPDAAFDAALNLFSSLGYLGDEEDTKVLAEIARVLRPGGRLVLETMHRDLVVRLGPEKDWRLLGEGRLLLEQGTFDPASGVAQSTQTLIDSSGDRDSRSFSIRVYTATELVVMLLRAGFAEARGYGDFDGAPLRPDSRLVIAARR
jgi:SAM-dependent methyltransferase